MHFISHVECKAHPLSYDTVREGHFNSIDLGAAVRGHLVKDFKASGNAVGQGQNLRGGDDVL